MVPKMNFLAGMLLVMVTFHSCTQEPSLQRYYVDNQEQPHFLSMDVPVSILNLDKVQLTQDQREAYESIQKLNLLAYKTNNGDQNEFEAELEKVKTILDQPKYEELLRGGNPEDSTFIIKILGTEDNIKEFILFGSTSDKGFAIVRVLGRDMDANKIMSLASALDKANVDSSQMEQFTQFFK